MMMMIIIIIIMFTIPTDKAVRNGYIKYILKYKSLKLTEQ
jgi:hypothetical protein